MVRQQLVLKGISDKLVLSAMERVPRHKFVPEEMVRQAYEDRALPVGEGQTISQPYMVAIMTELLELRPEDIVLEVGTGSGYQAAVLSLLSRQVYTVERIPELYRSASRMLKSLGYVNVEVVLADGTEGLPDKSPFDAVIVTAATPEVPPPLLEQLADGGRLVAPVGTMHAQTLLRIVRRGNDFSKDWSTPCVFVPLIGRHGF